MSHEVKMLTGLQRRLDRVDGKVDKKYMGEKIPGEDVITACLRAANTAEFIKKDLPKSEHPKITLLCGIHGGSSYTPAALKTRMEALLTVAERMPAFKLIGKFARNETKYSKIEKQLSGEDLLAGLLVQDMILATLLGHWTPNQPFHAWWAEKGLKVYIGSVNEMAKHKDKLGLPGLSRLNISTIPEAYGILEKSGQKYQFDATIFKPKPPKKK